MFICRNVTDTFIYFKKKKEKNIFLFISSLCFALFFFHLLFHHWIILNQTKNIPYSFRFMIVLVYLFSSVHIRLCDAHMALHIDALI